MAAMLKLQMCIRSAMREAIVSSPQSERACPEGSEDNLNILLKAQRQLLAQQRQSAQVFGLGLQCAITRICVGRRSSHMPGSHARTRTPMHSDSHSPTRARATHVRRGCSFISSSTATRFSLAIRLRSASSIVPCVNSSRDLSLVVCIRVLRLPGRPCLDGSGRCTRWRRCLS
eukprot:5933962-Pleurochrysis_carterae.AAC.1